LNTTLHLPESIFIKISFSETSGVDLSTTGIVSRVCDKTLDRKDSELFDSPYFRTVTVGLHRMDPHESHHN
jgi:hypothetical protein